jgi:uncharacterized protein (DUF433 family)
MQHVSSLGGPRVLLPTSDITRWIDELGDSSTPNRGLYGLACSIDGYCGVISPWGTPFLIFGDDANKRGGKPCVRGLRITVYEVLEYLASEMTEAEILDDFPDLTREDLKACIAYAADRERRFMTTPLSA